MATNLFTLAFAIFLSASPLSADVVDDMEALFKAYLDAGQTPEAREAIRSFWTEHDEAHADNVPYLLHKSQILSWLDEWEESERVFRQVPDEALTQAHHIFNRLQDRIEEGIGIAEPLMVRLAEADFGLFGEWLHDSFAQRYAPSVRAGVDLRESAALLERLAAPESPTAPAVAGLRAWVEAQLTSGDAEALRAIAQQELQGRGARLARYELLISGLLGSKFELGPESEQVLARVIERVEARRSAEFGGPALRARDRYTLAVASWRYAKLLRGTGEAELDWLMRTAKWDPDAADQESHHAFFYDRHTLGEPREFRSLVARRLTELGRTDDALRIWIELSFDLPDMGEVARIEVAKLAPGKDFDALWLSVLEDRLPMAPDFSLQTPTGETRRLSDLRGRWVLVDFWGTWCSPCRKELPDLEGLWRDVGASEVGAVLTIACNDTADAVLGFMKERDYTFPVVMGTEAVVEAYGVEGYPTKLLVTPAGRYMKLAFGVSDWNAVARSRMLAR